MSKCKVPVNIVTVNLNLVFAFHGGTLMHGTQQNYWKTIKKKLEIIIKKKKKKKTINNNIWVVFLLEQTSNNLFLKWENIAGIIIGDTIAKTNNCFQLSHCVCVGAHQLISRGHGAPLLLCPISCEPSSVSWFTDFFGNIAIQYRHWCMAQLRIVIWDIKLWISKHAQYHICGHICKPWRIIIFTDFVKTYSWRVYIRENIIHELSGTNIQLDMVLQIKSRA